MMRTSVRHSLTYLGRFGLAMITILAIAGTLSACGRYGSPVRVAPVEVGTVAPADGVEADAGDEDEDEMAEEMAE